MTLQAEKNDYEYNLIISFLKVIKEAGQEEKDMIDYWEDYKKYEAKSETPVIIANPSHHFGILNYSNFQENSWKKYNLKRSLKLSSKEIGRLYFNGRFYYLGYLIRVLSLLNNECEVKIIENTLCFKIDDKYCYSIGELIHPCYEINSDGVWFIDELYDEDTDDWTEITREFVKWNKGLSVREPKDRTRGSKDYLYDWSYWFDEMEEFGGFMML